MPLELGMPVYANAEGSIRTWGKDGERPFGYIRSIPQDHLVQISINGDRNFIITFPRSIFCDPVPVKKLTRFQILKSGANGCTRQPYKGLQALGL